MPPSGKVHFVTLGCPKNRVDSEIILGHLFESSFGVTPDPEDADVIIVNTCGFIEDAKQESIDAIFEMARAKESGRAKKLIVAGCLVQRYSKELSEEIPEIDALFGTGEYGSVADLAKRALGAIDVEERMFVSSPTFLHDATSPRVNTFMPHSAYMKVAEGCDQKCTFCIIPALRGKQRSRPVADLVREAQTLSERGIVELNLIAQDLTGYGYDRKPKESLADLVNALNDVSGIEWIRLHYAYPRPFSKALLDALAHTPKVLPYIDMPLQHIADPILKAMARGRPRKFVEKLLGELRDRVPNLTMRTSFIVGFPGETEDHFRELCDFVSAEDFERVGVFKFSREEGTPSYELDDQVPPEEIDRRYHHLMALLKEKSREKMATYVGRRIEVLVDGVSEETELLLAGRHKGQAPEVDGTTYINDGEAKAGDLVEVEITESFDYDLVGHIVEVKKRAPQRPEHPWLDTRSFGLSRGTTQHRSLPILGATT